MLRFIKDAWQQMGFYSKLFVLLFICLQIPAAYLVVNNMGCGFTLDRSAYEHMAQINRIYEGKPLYVPFTFEFCPITYTPLYWVLCSWFWKIFGPGVFLPKFVSLCSSLVVFYYMARFLWVGTSRDSFLTIFGLVMLSLINFFTSCWLIDININALHFAFTLAGFYCLKGSAARSAMLAALLLSLGALTKQTGLAYVAAGAAYILIKSPKKSLFYMVTALIVCGGGLAYLQLSSGGAFYDVVVKENQGPGWIFDRLLSEVWGLHFLGQFGILFLLSLWPVFSHKTFAGAWKEIITPEYTMTAAGLVVASIAQPKLGSGNLHAVIAMAGLVICGFRGIKLIMNQLGDKYAPLKFRNTTVLLQATILLIPAWMQTHVSLIDDADRQKYHQIEKVFKSGSTIMYHYPYPYIPPATDSPEGGHSGNENCRWINGQWSHEKKPAFLSQPYKEQKFDYVILGASIIEQSDPSIQAILNNYDVVAALPPHPDYPNSFMMRYATYILKAKRLSGR